MWMILHGDFFIDLYQYVMMFDFYNKIFNIIFAVNLHMVYKQNLYFKFIP